MVNNLDLVVHNSHILLCLKFIIVEIVSYPSSDNILRFLTERPNALVDVLRKSACAVAIFSNMCFKMICNDVMLIFYVWLDNTMNNCLSIPTYHHINYVVCN